MKKKILILALHYVPYVGGAEISVQNNFERLTKDFEIELITPLHSKKNKKVEMINEIKVIRTGFGNRTLDKLLFPLLGFFKTLFRKYDLLFCVEANQSALAGKFINIFKKRPTIVNIQAGFTEKDVKQKLGMFYFLYNLVYSKNFYYQCLSEDLKKRCLSHNCKKVTIVPNGYDSKVFNLNKDLNGIYKIREKFGFKPKDKIVITTSRLSKKNGIGDVIKAMKYLDSSIKFLICGDGELRNELENLVVKLDLSNRVKFAGTIPYKELPNYLHLSDVFIRPSLFEGFGNSFVEALACSVPIIGTRVGGIPDFLEDGKTGLFVKVSDPKDIAKKIDILLKDKKLYDTIVVNGLKMVNEKYDWDIIAEQTKEHIERVLK